MRFGMLLTAAAALWVQPAMAVTYDAGTLDPHSSLTPTQFFTEDYQTDTLTFSVSGDLELTVAQIALGGFYGLNTSFYSGAVGSGSLLGHVVNNIPLNLGSVSAGSYYAVISGFTTLNGIDPAKPQKYVIQLFADQIPPPIDPIDPIDPGLVPEPATWAMILMGVGLIGGGLRRQARSRQTNPGLRASFR